MEKHLLSKSTFIRGNQCVKSLYLNKKRPFLRDRLSAEQLVKFKRGSKLGIIAQRLFSGGIDVGPKSYRQYEKKLLETQQVITGKLNKVLYEAGFQYDRLLIFIDILVHKNNGWSAFEVKSSLHISDTFLLDAAFQYYVITNSGLSLKDFSIVYINKDYCFDGTIKLDELFVIESVFDRILPMQDYIKEKVKELKPVLSFEKSPPVEVGAQCTNPYPCDFIGHCWKNIPKEQWPQITHQSEDFYSFVDEIIQLMQEK